MSAASSRKDKLERRAKAEIRVKLMSLGRHEMVKIALDGCKRGEKRVTRFKQIRKAQRREEIKHFLLGDGTAYLNNAVVFPCHILDPNQKNRTVRAIGVAANVVQYCVVVFGGLCVRGAARLHVLSRVVGAVAKSYIKAAGLLRG